MLFLKHLFISTVAVASLLSNVSAQSSSDQCLQNIEDDPAAAAIKGKVAFNVKNQTIEMLANTQKPNAQEKKAILFWDTQRTNCINARLARESNQAIPASIRAIEINHQEIRKNLIVGLYAGNLTYGEFAKKSSEAYNKAFLARAEIVDQLSKQQGDEAARDRLIRAQENQARAALQNAETNRQSEADYLIGLGANILNSTRQVNPSPVAPRNVQCIQQGVFTNCTGY